MHLSHHGDRSDAEPIALDEGLLRAWPLPLDEHGDKLTRGTVLVIAGSTTTAGAALLAGTAALRMGAGRLQIATAEPIAMGLSIAMPEAMVLPLAVDDDNRLLPDHAVKVLCDHVPAAQAVLIGPGMDSPGAIRAIVDLTVAQMSAEAILVVDAAALPAITSVEQTARRSIATRLLLTPNRDELAELVNSLGIDKNAEPSMAASREMGAVITCFGDVTSCDERRWRAEAATPGLGTSGSGDVLAGLAVGAAARCGDAAQAACWATFVHGSAGNRLSERFGTMSFIARELLDEVPQVLLKLD
jgi:ADP-dependent NAD(P)H-hydrate dehydratase